jgi:hypothetical protein
MSTKMDKENMTRKEQNVASGAQPTEKNVQKHQADMAKDNSNENGIPAQHVNPQGNDEFQRLQQELKLDMDAQKVAEQFNHVNPKQLKAQERLGHKDFLIGKGKQRGPDISQPRKFSNTQIRTKEVEKIAQKQKA